MKKLVLILLLLSLACFPISAQKAKSGRAEAENYGLVVRGQVANLEVEKDKGGALFFVKLNVEFANEGTEPLILFKTSIDGEANRYWLGGWSLYVTEEDANKGESIFGDGYWESVKGSDFYKNLADRLDVKVPPVEETKILQPGERWNFADEFRLSFAGDNTSLYPKRKTWKEMQDFPAQLWLKFAYELSPWNVEHFKPDLIRKLQKRWARFGNVLVGKKKEGRFNHYDVISKPMPIDLSHAKIKESDAK